MFNRFKFLFYITIFTVACKPSPQVVDVDKLIGNLSSIEWMKNSDLEKWMSESGAAFVVIDTRVTSGSATVEAENIYNIPVISMYETMMDLKTEFTGKTVVILAESYSEASRASLILNNFGLENIKPVYVPQKEGNHSVSKMSDRTYAEIWDSVLNNAKLAAPEYTVQKPRPLPKKIIPKKKAAVEEEEGC